MRTGLIFAALCAAVLLGSVDAQADSILSPTGVTANTMGTSAGSLDRVRDGSGLPGFVSGVTDYATYVGSSPIHSAFSSANAWASLDGDTTGYIDFDLGATYSINSFALWNQDDGARQGVKDFSIYTSATSSFVGSTLVGSFAAADSLSVQSFGLTASTGRYVRLSVASNHGSTSFTTIGEVVLGVGSPVPEPTSIALLGLGLAGLGIASRRRKARAS